MGCTSIRKSVTQPVIIAKPILSPADTGPILSPKTVKRTPTLLIREAYHKDIREDMILDKLIGKGGFS